MLGFVLGAALGALVRAIFYKKPHYETSCDMLCSLSNDGQGYSKEWIFYNVLKKDGKNHGICCFHIDKKGFCKKFNQPCKYFKAIAKI